jgi:hypothetical protein
LHVDRLEPGSELLEKLDADRPKGGEDVSRGDGIKKEKGKANVLIRRARALSS